MDSRRKRITLDIRFGRA